LRVCAAIAGRNFSHHRGFFQLLRAAHFAQRLAAAAAEIDAVFVENRGCAEVLIDEISHGLSGLHGPPRFMQRTVRAAGARMTRVIGADGMAGESCRTSSHLEDS
jgi:hypothetical protein